jgi:hypothetical protein
MSVVMRSIHKDSLESMKLAAFQELQDALKIKRINDELLEFLTSSLRWLLHYSKKNNLPLPEKDRMMEILDRIMDISHKLPTKSQHPFKTPDDSTEPKYPLGNRLFS